jgi:hypothetical protein
MSGIGIFPQVTMLLTNPSPLIDKYSVYSIFIRKYSEYFLTEEIVQITIQLKLGKRYR